MHFRGNVLALGIAFLLALSGCGGGGGSTPSTGPGVLPQADTGSTISTQSNSVGDIGYLTLQGLWVANGTNVVEFTPFQFPGGVFDAPPHHVINSPVFVAPQGVQFDSHNDLWVVDGGAPPKRPALYEFSSTQLSNLGVNNHPLPVRTIKFSGFKFIQQAVFRNGNLWVTDNGANDVYEFSAAQVAVGGANVIPRTTIRSFPAFSGPLGIAFGANGNLWIANNGTTTLFEFNAPLPTFGTQTLRPDVILHTNHGSIEGPWALVFDSGGNLWSSNANSPNTIVKFLHAQILKSGAPIPNVTIFPTHDKGFLTLSSPNGIAFNISGDLGAISSLAPFGAAVYDPPFHTGAILPTHLFVGPKTTLNAPAGDTYGPVF